MTLDAGLRSQAEDAMRRQGIADLPPDARTPGRNAVVTPRAGPGLRACATIVCRIPNPARAGASRARAALRATADGDAASATAEAAIRGAAAFAFETSGMRADAHRTPDGALP